MCEYITMTQHMVNCLSIFLGTDVRQQLIASRAVTVCTGVHKHKHELTFYRLEALDFLRGKNVSSILEFYSYH